MDSRDPLYFHKTTRRDIYQSELQKAQRETGCFDVIFTNEKGDITEGSFTNIFIKQGDILSTPERGAGLLNGIYRKKLLDDPEIETCEKTLSLNDVYEAEQIFSFVIQFVDLLRSNWLKVVKITLIGKILVKFLMNIL